MLNDVRIGNDVLSMAAVACFGFLNGYCASLCLIVVNEIPDLSAEQRKTCVLSCFTLLGTVNAADPEA